MDRRQLLKSACASAAWAAAGRVLAGEGPAGAREPPPGAPSSGREPPPGAPPNFVIFLCDNLGYGDIACFGSKVHRTPNLDRMAAEGLRLASFYATSAVCSPSRASLMTGCYPLRVGLHEGSNGRTVLFPGDGKGLHPDEVTVAEVLKSRGYSTACIGKWHLGDQAALLPTRQGFDCYFGIPYSEDMVERKDRGWPPLPLVRGEKVIEAPADRSTLTVRFADEAVAFIDAHRAGPFFLYVAPVVPGSTAKPFASAAFRGKSANGAYGDSVEEMDWAVGQIMEALRRHGIDGRTLFIWTADNGAARGRGGSNGPFSGWSHVMSEGSMHVPCIVRWPGRVPAGRTSGELCTMMDLLPTLAGLAGAQAPQDRVIDGRDVWPILAGGAGARSPHEAFYYYDQDVLRAVRSGRWKLDLPADGRATPSKAPPQPRPARLYDLESDIGETTDAAAAHPDIVARLTALAEKARQEIGDRGRLGLGRRPAGHVDRPVPMRMAGG